MKRFLSKYSLKYPRSLVYMLQASEYKLGDFFDWSRRVKDFSHVEERKFLVKTSKAAIILIYSWLVYILLFVLSIFILKFLKGYLSYVLFLVCLFVIPYITFYMVAVFAQIINVLQYPIEQLIINKAKNKLQNHKALKIAIAGSYGKTTMKEILKTVLEENKKTRATPENKNTSLGIAKFIESLKGDEEILIFEMGEYYEGDIEKLCHLVNPDVGIITGVNEAHLDKFKDLEVTAKTIFELADFLKQKENTKLYVNGENRISKEKANHLKNQNTNIKIYLYGQNGIENINGENESNWQTEGAETDLSGVSFILKNNKEEGVVVKSKLLGLHQIGPLSVSAHTAQSLGIRLENIELSLKNTKPFEHRLELKEESGGVMVIDDSYNGSPDGVRAAINFIALIKNKRRFYITPGLVEMGKKTEFVHKNIGKQLAEAGIDKVILIRNSATPFIAQGLEEANFQGDIVWFGSALEAFAFIPKQTINNDLLLYQNDWPDNYA